MQVWAPAMALWQVVLLAISHVTQNIPLQMGMATLLATEARLLVRRRVLRTHAIVLHLLCFLPSVALLALAQLTKLPEIRAHLHAPLVTLLRLQE